MNRWTRDNLESNWQTHEMTISGITLRVSNVKRLEHFNIIEALVARDKLDKSKIIKAEVEVVSNGVGSMRTMKFYPVDSALINKDMLKEILDAENTDLSVKIYAIKSLIEFLNITKNTYTPPWRADVCKFKINEEEPDTDDDNWCIYMPTNHKRITLDDIDYVFNKKPSKVFLRSILGSLDLQNSDPDLVMQYIEKDRIDIFRVIGKSNTVQLSREHLKKIISLPQFSRQTTSGLIGSNETADVVNRRALITYQNAVDSEIFMEVIDTAKDEYSRGRLRTTLNRKSIIEKYKNYPEISLWLKMQ
jgi:hypothetical protein